MEISLDISKTLRSGEREFQLEVRFASAARRVVVHGPSGAGKSQMMKALAGLVTPDRGRIALAGRCLYDGAGGVNLPARERNVAYLFQDYALFPHLNVRQNVGFGLRRGWRNPRASVDEEAIRYWLRRFELEQVAHQFPHQLSGGQRQRVALARALAPRPSALLLDEPFAALDPGLRERMRAELDTLQRRLAIPMLIITHDPEDVRVFGEHVLRMDGGRIVEEQQP
ncbi:molybdate transport system ATP-binding protein [Duganella sp. SG902]|uniref:ABC transporter ATP-binding protein n=1 Tax=Duganella sp. SG902 TaxID=2587016 RepID=UPI00159D8FE7|nr:ATP-binding cassette domain-containing protein [Duganella sp. SG902]NVM79206.1 molybdate transport system ATP-binding protein [Duganella sp. SG902]